MRDRKIYNEEINNTKAYEFYENSTRDVVNIMIALDNEPGVRSEQDYENEKTIWVFDDNSAISICNDDISILDNIEDSKGE